MLYFFPVSSEAKKLSAMEEQWEFFVTSAKTKAESHTQASRFWGKVDTFFGLSLIFLSGIINSVYFMLLLVCEMNAVNSFAPNSDLKYFYFQRVQQLWHFLMESRKKLLLVLERFPRCWPRLPRFSNPPIVDRSTRRHREVSDL
jgi:hypothetical protein